MREELSDENARKMSTSGYPRFRSRSATVSMLICSRVRLNGLPSRSGRSCVTSFCILAGSVSSPSKFRCSSTIGAPSVTLNVIQISLGVRRMIVSTVADGNPLRRYSTSMRSTSRCSSRSFTYLGVPSPIHFTAPVRDHQFEFDVAMDAASVASSMTLFPSK